MTTYSGYIALLGRTNAGKSTLLNALLGTKLVGVSKKPQTTRNRILGILTREPYQSIFVDTPGIQLDTQGLLMRGKMNQAAWASIDADMVLYLVDIKRGWHAEDKTFWDEIKKKAKAKPRLLVTKSDTVKKIEHETLVANIAEQSDVDIDDILLVSAKEKESLESLRSFIESQLAPGPFYFDSEDLSDRPQSFLVAEFIREKVFRLLGQEIPFGIAVLVEHMEWLKDENRWFIRGVILLSEERHKPIVIGAKGSMIKKIGQDSRETISQFLEAKVHLELLVKVKEGWQDRPSLIEEYQQL